MSALLAVLVVVVVFVLVTGLASAVGHVVVVGVVLAALAWAFPRAPAELLGPVLALATEAERRANQAQ